ncbi:MAG: transposase, partial [Chloroflexus sp.]|nr:transposase [Chloroflexus sp.]
PKSISSFVAGFKSATTKRINEYRQTPGMPVWQPRFHDHIIRNDVAYQRITAYIRNNPARWERDRFHREQE